MSGFCVECGEPLDDPKICPSGHLQRPAGMPPERIVEGNTLQNRNPFPKASTPRRLLGSGVEYVTYIAVLTALTMISALSLGFLDMLLVPLLLLMIGIRDVNAGLFSISKRLGRMRVVEYKTGKPATNGQAFLRNSYYLALAFLMFFPIIFTDVAASMFFMLFVVVDVILITLGKEGRRIGDLLAKTQVVHEAKKA